ncbi:MAG: hypothetical protein KHY46_05235 [Clostridiales bacterium]|nr:hypothetical protein [Clostridiales bacterium]
MDLQTIYELRERLEAAAIAGAGLLSEDFRLKRAVQQIGPLAEASPVFKKIQAMAAKVTEEGTEDRAGLLLDTLSLLDAVLCTQGGLEGPGETEPIKGERAGTIEELSYSRLAPLAEAFLGTGGGRYARIRDSHQYDPELFQDYRVKRLMLKGLSDSYAELADQVALWFQKEGKGVTGFLKEGFDAQGKRDMARRVEIIKAAAGAEENEWFRALALHGSKEVKEAAIQALGCSQENDGFLLDLVKTEKGKIKEAALSALAYMNSPSAREFWNKYMMKHPAAGASYLSSSEEDWASDLTGEQILRCLEEKPEGKEKKAEQMERLRQLWRGTEGKHSPRLCSCCEPVYKELPDLVVDFLTDSILKNSHPQIRETVRQMYEAHGDVFLESVFLDALIHDEPKEVYERFHRYFEDSGKQREKDCLGIIKGLSRMEYSEEKGRYILHWHGIPNRGEDSMADCQPRGLDVRWYSLLLHYEGCFEKKMRPSGRYGDRLYDWVLEALFNSRIPELKKEYGLYFYKSALHYGTEEYHIRMLKRCGWEDYRGLITAAAERGIRYGGDIHRLRWLLEELPLDRMQKAKELDEILTSKNIEDRYLYTLSTWKYELEKGEDCHEP